ncbi:MAG: hypothetical protein E7197_04410 [Anaerovibrio sp.]|uniref:flagellar filament capping protein FliD n=1 Tax=Anaerovibrio sp. TaxID=1872532 RepID=UPI0025B8AF73|nr:flagellar filament capping protein FliD [Anaerovibrio sp.]MBE6099277.1 hypothetical protein [Anaerovibrio sp.]
MGVNGIYGLSGSGLDIESLVKMGMSSKNKQYDKMEQKEIANTWLKEAYNTVYNDMTVYKYDTLSTYKMQSNLNAMSATSSNTGVVTATANGAAASMNHTVTVKSIASNAYLLTAQKDDGTNYGVTRNNTSAATSNKLADVIFKGFTKLSESDDGVGFYNINLADGTGKNVSGSDIAISLTLKDSVGDDAKEYTLTYTYDDLFKDEKTLNDFASAIARTGANIQGGYDTANDSFSLYNKTSGKDNIIGIVADNTNTATLLNNLNLGSYNAATNELSDRISFTSNSAMPTTMESNGVTNSAKSVTMKDVLGLKATSVKNDDGSYTITVRDKDNQALGTFTKNGDTITGDTETAFSMTLSNGTDSAEVKFTLGELFNLNDIGTKSSLGGNAGLDELAAKINATGLGISANYDSAKDSFSLTNPTGQAELTANGTGASQTVANTLINSLNLVNSTNIAHKVTTKTGMLASILEVTSNMNQNFDLSYNMKVNQSGAQIATINNGSISSFLNGTYANRSLFSFDISDGNNTARVNLTYGDVINFAGMENKDGYSMYVRNQSGQKINLNTDAGTVNVQAAQNNLSVIADKINSVAEANGLNITASYDATSGKFSLLNTDGEILLTDVTGSFVSKLGLTDDREGVAYKVSSGIARVNETSTEDSLADALGFTAVKNSDGTLTVTDVDGNSSVVNATDTAFAVKIGDSDNQAEVSFTYGDLFDISGSGNLKSKAAMSDFADKINTVATANSINVTAEYNADTGKFTLSNDGGFATLAGVDALGTALVTNMGLKESESTASARDHSWAGTNAEVTIDGKTYDNTTNKLTVSGVTYTFLEQTEPGQKATISVSQDTDKIVDYMKSFVEDYNKILDSLNEKLSEQKYSDYKPLSKRQEDEMTEKQIEKWNEKAKSGLLYHNSTIRDLVSAMREAIYTRVDAVDSEYNSLSAIGITTTNTKGHLTLDTDKLRKALAADPDCVYQLFASDQDSSYIAGSTDKNKITDSQKKEDYANTGVSNRLYNVMTNYMSKISDIAGTSKETDDQSYLGKMITDMKTRMSNFKTQMTAYENKLFKRYDAMEVALSRISAQLSYITNSFS